MVWQPVLGILKCVHMLMHAIAHDGCTNTVIESALKVDSGRKVHSRAKESTLRQYCAWPFGPTLYELSYPATVFINMLNRPLQVLVEKGIKKRKTHTHTQSYTMKQSVVCHHLSSL